MNHFIRKTLLMLIFFSISNCFLLSNKQEALIQNKDYDVVKIMKKKQPVYTQGLFYSDDGKYLFESGGLYDESSLVKMSYPSLETVKIDRLEGKYFGEGIAKCGNYIYQLTWREGTVLKFTYPEMENIGTIALDPKVQEGWGLCESWKKDELLATDGSNHIYILNCNKDLKWKDTLFVTYNGIPVDNLNSLVFAKGYIWSNRYYDSSIYKIDPQTGNVVKKYDMEPLVNYEIMSGTLSQYQLHMGDVLNGITYDKLNDRFLLTGKKWTYFYEVVFK